MWTQINSDTSNPFTHKEFQPVMVSTEIMTNSATKNVESCPTYDALKAAFNALDETPSVEAGKCTHKQYFKTIGYLLAGQVERSQMIEDTCKDLNDCPTDALECKTTSGGTTFFVYDNQKCTTQPTWIQKPSFDQQNNKEVMVDEFDAAANTDCMSLCEMDGNCNGAEYDKNTKKCKLSAALEWIAPVTKKVKNAKIGCRDSEKLAESTGKSSALCYHECYQRVNDGCKMFELTPDGTCRVYKNYDDLFCSERYFKAGQGTYYHLLENDITPVTNYVGGDTTGAKQILFKELPANKAYICEKFEWQKNKICQWTPSYKSIGPGACS